jgi:hypothetical protein
MEKNVVYLEIDVLTSKDIRDKEHIKHHYEMRANWTITGYQKRFNKWLKLMESEKYVCLAGHFVDLEKEVGNRCSQVGILHAIITYLLKGLDI